VKSIIKQGIFEEEDPTFEIYLKISPWEIGTEK
jgi:hypothetical protein